MLDNVNHCQLGRKDAFEIWWLLSEINSERNTSVKWDNCTQDSLQNFISVHLSLLSISPLFFYFFFICTFNPSVRFSSYIHFSSFSFSLLSTLAFLFSPLILPQSPLFPHRVSFFPLISYPFCIHDSLFLHNSIEEYSKRDEILLRFSHKWRGEWRKDDLNSINPTMPRVWSAYKCNSLVYFDKQQEAKNRFTSKKGVPPPLPCFPGDKDSCVSRHVIPRREI